MQTTHTKNMVSFVYFWWIDMASLLKSLVACGSIFAASCGGNTGVLKNYGSFSEPDKGLDTKKQHEDASKGTMPKSTKPSPMEPSVVVSPELPAAPADAPIVVVKPESPAADVLPPMVMNDPVKESKPDNVPKLADYNSTMKAIIDTKCKVCHEKDYDVNTFEQILPLRQLYADAISKGRMPKGESGYKDTTQGKQLIKWLKEGIL